MCTIAKNMSEIEIDDFNVIIPKHYDYNNLENIEVVEASALDYKEFFDKFMVKNIPCIVKNINNNWECVHKWVVDGQIDHDYFIKTYGHLEAPVADCSDSQFNSHCKKTMKVYDYINYLNRFSAVVESSADDEELLYLKDWHLRRLRPDDTFYVVPFFFASDWLNEIAQDYQDDDFMFVYIGPKNSWTPLHVDVYCSYSWSVNVLGIKKWILFPPGEEMKLKDKLGNLPLQYKQEMYSNVRYFEIIQEEGDAIFVPSGWHHQVVNLVDTISINHNWINGCNIQQVWEALQSNLTSVEKEISELKNTEDFPLKCQVILKSFFGMDYSMFIIFVCRIGKKRLNQLKSGNTKGFGNYKLGIKHIKFDLNNIVDIMEKISHHPLFINKNIVSIPLENELLSLWKSIFQYLNI